VSVGVRPPMPAAVWSGGGFNSRQLAPACAARYLASAARVGRARSGGWWGGLAIGFGAAGALVGGAVATGVITIPRLGSFTAATPPLTSGSKCTEDDLVQSVLASRAVALTPNTEVVERLGVVAAVADYLATPLDESGVYMVVEGPRGCGKTTAVERAASGRDGVINVTLPTVSGSSVFGAIAARLGGKLAAETTQDEYELAKLFRKAAAARLPTSPAWAPVVIVEMERGASDADVSAAARSLKRLCVDCRAAHVVIVLSEANAAFALPADPFRQRFLWVDDFTEAEAHAYWDARGFLVADRTPATAGADKCQARRAEVLREVGTRLAMLKAAAAAGSDSGLDAFLLHCRNKADKDLEGLLNHRPVAPEVACTDGVAFDRLVRELLKAGDGGVPRATTVGYLASPERIGRVTREHKAVLYHMTTDTYRFYSTAHRRAAERYYAQAQKSWWW